MTGSDSPKTIEQVGLDVFNQADYSFNCIANDIYKKGQPFFTNTWLPDNKLLEYLNKVLSNSIYPKRFGNHIEVRTGMLNFSILGRNAQGADRTDYYQWDIVNQERQSIASDVQSRFPYLSAVVGGETGIDIFPAGNDKSQCLKFFPGLPIHFFGDSCEPGGNDFSLANILKDRTDCIVSNVKDWKETWSILKKYMNLQTVV